MERPVEEAQAPASTPEYQGPRISMMSALRALHQQRPINPSLAVPMTAYQSGDSAVKSEHLKRRDSDTSSQIASFISHGAEAVGIHASQDNRQTSLTRPPFFLLVLLVIAHIYADASIPLWQKLYREAQMKDDRVACQALWMELERLGNGGDDSEVDDGGILGGKKLSERDCSWFIHKEPQGEWKRQPHTFTKGFALSMQASIGCTLFYLYNFYDGGMEQLKKCWSIRGLLSFGPVGVLFGLTAVFGFLAQDALTPGSYALYAQTGVVVIPVMWCIAFRKTLPILTWLHIVMIAGGIVMYRVSELHSEVGGSSSVISGVGVLWVSCKVLAGGVATIWAEAFLKSDASIPFSVQASWIMPWKALSTLSTIWLLPPHGLPADRPGGFFHDWNILTLWIVCNNLSDTILSAIVAKVFDSVVKAICGVAGIIFPTWILSLMLGWEDLDLSQLSGQIKAFGGSIVIVGSFAYVFGRNANQRADRLACELESAKAELKLMQSTSGGVNNVGIYNSGINSGRTAGAHQGVARSACASNPGVGTPREKENTTTRENPVFQRQNSDTTQESTIEITQHDKA